MAKGKSHHVFVNVLAGNDENDGSEAFPLRSVDKARKMMELRGKCTGIRLLGEKVYSSPCGMMRCGACTKANGRRLCPGEGCERWISVSAKQHPECGWRKQEEEKKSKIKEVVFRPDDNHGFEKLKRKMVALAHQAAMQYGWDGVIMGYAAKVGRGGSTGRITFVSPQNELYCTDERGTIKVQAGLEDNLAMNADNALTLIRQKICPSERAHMLLKHENPHLMGDAMDMAAVQGPELPQGMEDKAAYAGAAGGAEGLVPDLHWLSGQMGEKLGKGALPLQAAMLGVHAHHMPSPHDMTLPLDSASAAVAAAAAANVAAMAAVAEEKRKMELEESASKRVREE